MINIAELITDPDFCQTITIKRTSIVITNHREVPTEATLTTTGIITIYNDKSSQLLPEANRSSEEIHVFTKIALYTTSLQGSTQYQADKIVFNGDNYLVQSALNDLQYGFCRATATREKQR